MDAARTLTTAMVREVLQGYCKPDVRVSNAELYNVFDLKNEVEKDRLRARLNDMAHNGELIRVERGLFEYNFKYRVRKNVTFPAIWRFIRMKNESWSYGDVCQLTRISYSQVKRYCDWLENEGYIARYGKKGTTVLYRAANKADCTPETPYPNMTDRNPFERENAAAAELARLMLCHDPYQLATVRKIVAACKVLLARFDTTFNQNENNGGENHV